MARRVGIGVLSAGLLALLALLSACAPIPIPTPTPTDTLEPTTTARPTPTATPSTGKIDGALIGRDSGNPISGALVVLCAVVEDGKKCEVQSDFRATTDAAGAFQMYDVPPGTYTLAYAEEAAGAEVAIEGGEVEDLTNMPFQVISGGYSHSELGLSFVITEKVFHNFDVTAGDAVKVQFPAWGK